MEDLQSGIAKDAENYRYPGFRPFEDNKRDRMLFFGRSREKDLLLHKITANRLVVLYAKSGMGKTSLLNAGVFQELRELEYLPLTIRVNGIDRDFMTEFYRRIENEKDKCKESGFISDFISGEKNSLWEYFKTAEFWTSDDKLLTPVLVLDQFEELFTLSRSKIDKDIFVKQLADLVRGRVPLQLIEKYSKENQDQENRMPYTETPPDIKIIIAIRESHYGRLQELSKKIPGIFENRFLLDPLDRDNARQAIAEPTNDDKLGDIVADTSCLTYTDAAINRILDFLCPTKKDQNNQTATVIEPFQLQLLCSRIEVKTRKEMAHPDDQKIIQADDLTDKWMNNVLEEFYEDEIRQLPADNRRKVRKLIEKGLIDKSGRRIPVHESTITSDFQIGRDTLKYLTDRRLLRREPRGDSCLYELSHDTMVKPIRESQKKRNEKKHTIAFQIVMYIILGAFSILLHYINTADYQYNKVISTLKNDEYDDATQLLESAIEKYPNYKKIAFYVGSTAEGLRKQNKPTKSIEDIELTIDDLYEKAINKNPKNSDLHLALANEYYSAGNDKDAIASYKKAEKLGSTYPRLYLNMGNAYFRLKDYKNSIGSYKKVKGSEDHDLYKNMGDAYFRLEDYKNSIESYKKAKDSEDPGLYKNMGDAYFRLRNYENSIESYEKALDIKPDIKDQQFFLDIGSAYFNQGEFKEAEKYYVKAHSLINTDIFIKFGILYDQNRNIKKAIQSYETAIEIKPEAYQAYLNLGNFYSKYKEYPKAIENYSQAIKFLRKNNTMTEVQKKKERKKLQYLLGNAYSCNKQFDEAIKFYDIVIAENPNYRDVQKRMESAKQSKPHDGCN